MRSVSTWVRACSICACRAPTSACAVSSAALAASWSAREVASASSSSCCRWKVSRAWTRAARRAASCACSAVTEASALRSLMRWGWASTSAIRSPALTCWPSSTFRRLTWPDTWAPTETSSLACSRPTASTVCSRSPTVTAAVAYLVAGLALAFHSATPAIRQAPITAPTVHLRLNFILPLLRGRPQRKQSLPSAAPDARTYQSGAVRCPGIDQGMEIQWRKASEGSGQAAPRLSASSAPVQRQYWHLLSAFVVQTCSAGSFLTSL